MDSDIYAVKLQKHTKEYTEAKNTLSAAFPKKEQSPFWALCFMAKHKNVDFLCFYDKNNNYIGVSYSIHDKIEKHNNTSWNRLMILYLAVDPKVRSKGFGSKIVNYLQKKDNIDETVLDVESPYEQADNQRQRLNRLAFYEHLGFRSSYHEIIEPECHYLILGKINANDSDKKVFDAVETYTSLTDKLTRGLCKLNIQEVINK